MQIDNNSERQALKSAREKLLEAGMSSYLDAMTALKAFEEQLDKLLDDVIKKHQAELLKSLAITDTLKPEIWTRDKELPERFYRGKRFSFKLWPDLKMHCIVCLGWDRDRRINGKLCEAQIIVDVAFVVFWNDFPDRIKELEKQEKTFVDIFKTALNKIQPAPENEDLRIEERIVEKRFLQWLLIEATETSPKAVLESFDRILSQWIRMWQRAGGVNAAFGFCP